MFFIINEKKYKLELTLDDYQTVKNNYPEFDEMIQLILSAKEENKTNEQLGIDLMKVSTGEDNPKEFFKLILKPESTLCNPNKDIGSLTPTQAQEIRTAFFLTYWNFKTASLRSLKEYISKSLNVNQS
jgi:hypothetical protein